MCLNNYVYQFHLNFLQAVSFNGYYFELQRIRNRYVLHSWCEFSNQIKSLLLSHCQETTHCNIKDKTCPVIGRHSVLQLIHPSHENFVREIHLIGCVVKKTNQNSATYPRFMSSPTDSHCLARHAFSGDD